MKIRLCDSTIGQRPPQPGLVAIGVDRGGRRPIAGGGGHRLEGGRAGGVRIGGAPALGGDGIPSSSAGRRQRLAVRRHRLLPQPQVLDRPVAGTGARQAVGQ